MDWRHLMLAAAGLLLSFGSGAFASPDGDPLLGARLYVDGVTGSGEPAIATTRGDIVVRGTQLSCANCHRRSGMGSSEGGNYVPPITARHLFADRKLGRELRNERFKELYKEAQPKSFWVEVRMPRLRPAYSEETLARAIREGVSASGRPLATLMPRYDLGARDMANLLAYLSGLSAADDPGVDEETIEFATIVAGDVAPGRRQAFLDVVEAFFKWANTDTSGDLTRGNFSPYYRTDFVDAYRRWRLHVWELDGTPETWPEQLARHYADQPVFAVVSGLVDGPWAPVAEFCDAERLPCLFPNTTMPATEGAEGGYSLYFSRGLELEGEALAAYLAGADATPRTVVQIRNGADGAVPAEAFVRAARGSLAQTAIDTVVVASGAELRAAIKAASQRGPDVLVLWPGRRLEAALETLRSVDMRAPLVVLPSMAVDAVDDGLAQALGARLRFTFPYEVSLSSHPRSYRVRAWMRTRRIDISDWRLQSQTYYALSVLRYGLENLLTDFHRDYLIETIEHEAENNLNPGTYPKLALGPGQRFASKGAYVVRLELGARRSLKAVSAWLVP